MVALNIQNSSSSFNFCPITLLKVKFSFLQNHYFRKPSEFVDAAKLFDLSIDFSPFPLTKGISLYLMCDDPWASLDLNYILGIWSNGSLLGIVSRSIVICSV